MFLSSTNQELNYAIEIWNLPNHYTFTRNIGNDGNGNPYEGVVIQFTIDKRYFTFAGFDPNNTAGVTYIALKITTVDEYRDRSEKKLSKIQKLIYLVN